MNLPSSDRRRRRSHSRSCQLEAATGVLARMRSRQRWHAVRLKGGPVEAGGRAPVGDGGADGTAPGSFHEQEPARKRQAAQHAKSDDDARSWHWQPTTLAAGQPPRQRPAGGGSQADQGRLGPGPPGLSYHHDARRAGALSDRGDASGQRARQSGSHLGWPAWKNPAERKTRPDPPMAAPRRSSRVLAPPS